MKKDNNVKAFFALVRAGLWEKDVQLLPLGNIDFAEVQRFAEEQSVLGLVAAGLDHVTDMRVPKRDVLQIVSQTLLFEQRNDAMNYFIGILVEKLRDAGIYALLVKGQGVARCYERPSWRSCGDVDLLLDAMNYEKAKAYLTPLAASVEEEDKKVKHLGMNIDTWVVELHGTLHGGISKRVNSVIDEVQDDTFKNGHVRVWENNETSVFLPALDNDAIFIFVHFVNHFFRGGLGLRQICDWCRLLWTYRKEIDVDLLEMRVRDMGLLDEWRAFAVYAVEYLGMPVEAMPLYETGYKWKRKATRMNSYIMEVGNFGHNRDHSFYEKYPYLVYKVISLSRHIGDFFRHLMIFPKNSLNVFCGTFFGGLRAMTKGR